MDDRRVLNGIIFVNRNGLRWRDAPKDYGPHKTLYNRWKQGGDKGVFLRMMDGLAAPETSGRKTVIIDATYLKARRTASSLQVKKHAGRLICCTKGGTNTKLHAITDANGRPLSFFMTAGHVSDYIAAAALLDELPKAQWLLADRGYDADWFRDALQEKGIKPCISGRKIPEQGRQIRQAPLQTAQPHRDHIRTPQGLAPRCDPLRQVPHSLLLCHCTRCYRHLLALICES
ncbi:transposase [Komagataeibacter swingsii DSM 16373]|nr:transposase [Komagataeibacter swingsii DSM 16373]